MKKTLKLISLCTISLLALAMFFACGTTSGNTGSNGSDNTSGESNNTQTHEHVVVIDEALAPTCNSSGLTEGKHCSICNEILVYQEPIPPLDHDLIHHDGKPATCTENGYISYETCLNCDYTTYEEIPALGHNFVGGSCTHCGLPYGSGDIENNDTYTKDGKYIYFGSYPQTKVEDISLISALNSLAGTLPTSGDSYNWTSYGYYIEGSVQDYMWYIDKTYNNEKYRGVYFTSYRPYWCNRSSIADNSWQDNNGYNLNTVYWFKYNPVKWRILTEENEKAFLMCDIAIDAQQYYHIAIGKKRTINGKTVYENNYAESEIRKWLNETFYNTTFNALQKSLINTTEVDNSARSTNPYNNATEWDNGNNSYACENTSDKVFLLSEYEITNPTYGFNSSYSIDDTARQLKGSDYAKSQGCCFYRYTDSTETYRDHCLRWLRSPYCGQTYGARSLDDNGCSIDGSSVHNTSFGIVPALWLDISGTTYTRAGNYIYFGSYPQTKVEDTSLVSELNSLAGTLPTSDNFYNWTSYGYYISGAVQNFMWYVDETFKNEQYRGVYFTSYRPGTCIDSSSEDKSKQDDNGYNLNTVCWFKYDPIKWRILAEENGKAFLMCDMAIDAQQYDYDGSYSNNYKESTIRKWLNETFYNIAFNALQKSLIQTTLVDNSARSTNPYNTELNGGINDYACGNTFDKVFLLSEYEVTNPTYGFDSEPFSHTDTTRRLKCSEYAKSQGCSQFNQGSAYDGNCWWWLRSPYSNDSKNALNVYISGCAFYYRNVNTTGYGVVPALWIAL